MICFKLIGKGQIAYQNKVIDLKGLAPFATQNQGAKTSLWRKTAYAFQNKRKINE
jgi:hypothetical protein